MCYVLGLDSGTYKADKTLPLLEKTTTWHTEQCNKVFRKMFMKDSESHRVDDEVVLKGVDSWAGLVLEEDCHWE